MRGVVEHDKQWVEWFREIRAAIPGHFVVDHIDLREYLRAHSADAIRYGELKLQLAHLLSEDPEAYLSGKAELIAELLAKARSSADQM